MEEHRGVVPARKSKCAAPARKSKVEAMAAGGGGIRTVAAVVTVIGIADLSLFNDHVRGGFAGAPPYMAGCR
jgi:hypothetical protein